MTTIPIKRNRQNRRIAIEISSRDIALVIVDRAGRDAPRVRGRHLTWSSSPSSLDKQEGIQQLSSALATLANRERISGASVRLVLSSDYCVTRVVAGSTDKVLAELCNLRERCAHYLRLGAGPKAHAESSRAIDAKHTQTWLTVTNENTLANIVRAVRQAGLKIELIEHSMVAACRALKMVNTEGPAMLVELNRRGADLGVSHQGCLLFDYRPGGIDSKENLGEIITRHMDRIHRYCHRNFRFASGRISRVYLCGDPEDTEQVRRQFDDISTLTAEVLDLPAVFSQWKYDQEFPADSRFLAPLGSTLADSQQNEDGSQDWPANLLEHFRRAGREPLKPALYRLTWPIAASLAIAIGLVAASLWEHRIAANMERQVAEMETQQVKLLEVKQALDEAISRNRHFRAISTRVVNPAWNEAVSAIGRCLPKDTWLDSIHIDDSGLVAITGTSCSEDQVFELVRYLKKVPLLTKVNLEAQRPTTSPAGPAITFDLKCNFNDRSDLANRVARND